MELQKKENIDSYFLDVVITSNNLISKSEMFLPFTYTPIPQSLLDYRLKFDIFFSLDEINIKSNKSVININNKTDENIFVQLHPNFEYNYFFQNIYYVETNQSLKNITTNLNFLIKKNNSQIIFETKNIKRVTELIELNKNCFFIEFKPDVRSNIFCLSITY